MIYICDIIICCSYRFIINNDNNNYFKKIYYYYYYYYLLLFQFRPADWLDRIVPTNSPWVSEDGQDQTRYLGDNMMGNSSMVSEWKENFTLSHPILSFLFGGILFLVVKAITAWARYRFHHECSGSCRRV